MQSILSQKDHTNRRLHMAVKREMKFLGDSVSGVLDFCSSFKDIHITTKEIHAIEISFTEGLTNAIKQPPVLLLPDNEDKIDIEINLRSNSIEILIHDYGEGFDINKAELPNLNQHPEGGYGIFLIKNFMDDVSYKKETNRNTLKMIKQFGRTEGQDIISGMNILVVDDDEQLRNILTRFLSKQGHTVFEAGNAGDAFKTLMSKRIQIVISDWMMPGEDGISFCKRIREHNFNYYIYFILLTGRASQDDIIMGLEAGADDFISKPFDKKELMVRLRAGERVINLELDLAVKNKNLQEANNKIEDAYLRIRHDLEYAEKIQTKLLPEKKNPLLEDMHFDWIFLPSDFVAGDLFNYFQINEDYAAFYVFDVSGHGVASAMLSFTLNRELFPNKNASGLIYQLDSDGKIKHINSPSQTVSELNKLYYTDSPDFQFFTIFYGLYNRKEKTISFVQGGHPPGILVKKNGEVKNLTSNGPAIGIFYDLDFIENTVKIDSGDRLYIYSDGVTECTNRSGEEFSEVKLEKLLAESNNKVLEETFYTLKMELLEWSDGKSFGDDITLLGIEFT